jgi:putative ABC transport system substrate-binding protein
MIRRRFIAGLASTAAWPVVARSQQAAITPVIGFLNIATPETWSSYLTEFKRGLGQMGYVEGSNVAFEYRWPERNMIGSRRSPTN